MRKQEIISRLEKLYKELEMKPQDFIREWNERHQDTSYILDMDRYYAFMTGRVQGEIEWILTNGHPHSPEVTGNEKA